jgi:intracellular septation protein A
MNPLVLLFFLVLAAIDVVLLLYRSVDRWLSIRTFGPRS